jgi:hypothetical protein
MAILKIVSQATGIVKTGATATGDVRVISDDSAVTTLATPGNHVDVVGQEPCNVNIIACCGDGEETNVAAVAGSDLSGHRVVEVFAGVASYADYRAAQVARKRLGVTSGAAMSGSVARIRLSGRMVEPSWNWSDGPIFLGEQGALTQICPAIGNIVQVARAISPTEIFIQTLHPIARS